MGGRAAMTLVELKDYITNKQIPTEFLIFVCNENKFLAKQYIDAIAKVAPNGITKVNSIYEPSQSSLCLLTDTDETINVVFTDTFDERAENYTQFINTIVVCDQVDKSIADIVEKHIIKFPVLADWQVYDYAKTLCPALTDDDIKWLIKVTDSDIDKITSELQKITIFNVKEQEKVFSELRYELQAELYKVDLFAVVNALVDGNKTLLFDLLKHNAADSLDPVILANRTFNSLKNIILISQNPGLTAEACGVSTGQFKYIKFNYRSLNVNAVKQKLKFLTQFDLDLKTSKLELSKQDLLSYLVNNLAYKIT
jgi:hypothetical protein